MASLFITTAFSFFFNEYLSQLLISSSHGPMHFIRQGLSIHKLSEILILLFRFIFCPVSLLKKKKFFTCQLLRYENVLLILTFSMRRRFTHINFFTTLKKKKKLFHYREFIYYYYYYYFFLRMYFLVNYTLK